MKTIQQVKFRDVDDFLFFLPIDELAIVELLRQIITECLPNSTEKLSYNVPFFYGRSRICYVWPAAIPWGGIKAGVAIGFCRGSEFKDESDYLERRGKSIALKVFQQVGDIDIDLLKSYLFEASDIDLRQSTP